MHYLYTYSYFNEDELSLCQLEMRSFFGFDTQELMIESSIRIDPSRSPFIKERIAVMYKGHTLEEIIEQVKTLTILNSTYKVIFIKNSQLDKSEKVGFDKRRMIERNLGLQIKGEVDLVQPEVLFGIMQTKEGWVFGEYCKSEAIWLHHQKKPQGYSTALSTRVARAIVNIAAPDNKEIKVIDPCCGIGTVLIEALSMGIDIIGSDRNPLVCTKARENIAHFGLKGEVILREIQNVNETFDVAIIDMPYNLCSVISNEEKLDMLESARRIAKKVVIITIEPIDSIIEQAQFKIVDRCEAKKANFIRQVIVCE